MSLKFYHHLSSFDSEEGNKKVFAFRAVFSDLNSFTINKQDLEICSRTKILDIYIEDVEKMLNGLETLQHTSPSHDGLQVVRAGIEELKKDHQNVKDRFTVYARVGNIE
ncbi:hypothetical protein QYF36_025123 [Acer negundo]|nr:hypothetical protein QYF36_025123 [Acer negundo]